MNLAKMIDHTLLKPGATQEQIAKLLMEAKEYKFASVCVNPCWVSFSAQELAGTDVKVCTVIGFPLGASTTAVKVFEAQDAIRNGATEVDMVIAVGRLKAGEDKAVEADIRGVVEAAKGKALVKVIIETCLLTDEEKVRVCRLCVNAGADFVKTSTGFSTGGATAEDVTLMRKAVGPKLGVKASGGIRGKEDLERMVAAGASRIGASSGVSIMQGESTTGTY
jgi:deoxyribose-phosphate aldolase